MKVIQNKDGLFNVDDNGSIYLSLAETSEEALIKYQEALDFQESPEFVEEARLENIATQYQRDRQYPSIGDQLDALFHAGAFPADMAAQIQAVKDANPKPVA
mgnify:FL=1|jgi:hypothetical protein